MSTPKPAKYFNVYLDSDGPIADFKASLDASGMHTDDFKHVPGVYLYLSVTAGAAEYISRLKALDDIGEIRVWVLTKTPSGSPYAYTEKVLWYTKNFPWLEDRVILAHDKSLVGTDEDFLLDDRPHKGNARLFRGDFVLFREDEPENSWHELWTQVLNRLEFWRKMDTL
jgi:5'(3')-deoxyribonucleotidase